MVYISFLVQEVAPGKLSIANFSFSAAETVSGKYSTRDISSSEDGTPSFR